MKEKIAVVTLCLVIASIRCSADTWEVVSAGIDHDIVSVEWDGSRFVAVDDSTGVLESYDGRTWTRQQLPLFNGGSLSRHRAIISGGGQYLIPDLNGRYRESKDFATWTARDSGFSKTINGGVWHDGEFVVVGEGGTILTSTNGVDWTKNFTSPTSSSLECIDYGKGLFIAGGLSGVFTSPTSSIWTPQTTGGLFPVTGVAISDERFVVVTWGEVLTSTTGASWTRNLIAPLTGPPYPNAVCAGDSKFVMVCSAGKAFETTDGVVCSPINLLTTSDINDVAYGAGAFVAVGDGGMVRVSGVVSVAPPKLSVSIDSSTVEVVILVTGQAGQGALIEHAPSLTGWADLQQVTLDSAGSKTIRLPYDPELPRRFFRVGAP